MKYKGFERVFMENFIDSLPTSWSVVADRKAVALGGNSHHAHSPRPLESSTVSWDALASVDFNLLDFFLKMMIK